MSITPERRAEARRQDILIQRSAPALRRLIAREKNIYIRQSAEAYRNTGHLRDSDFFAHESRIRSILYNHYLRIGRRMNDEISSQIKGQRPDIERKSQSKFEYRLRKWAIDEAGRKAKPIAGTTQKDINRAVQRAYDSESPETIVIREILAVRGYSNFRADAVARTETHSAAMYASILTSKEFAEEEGVTMVKIWSPTIDDRSRDGHLEMENHPPVAMDGFFDVPNPTRGGSDRMDRPGDATAPPEQVINCRCVLTYEVK